MNRSQHFDLCEQLLAWLCLRIELRGKLNILNLHLHCEDFYLYLLNNLFGLQLQNSNAKSHNVEGIDLIDDSNKVVLQVSATATKAKVEAALGKDLSKYKGYSFRFVSISKDASDLRIKSYNNPHALAFNPAKDIYDVASLLNVILHLDIDRQKNVSEFLKKELGHSGLKDLSPTNVADVISLISQQDLTDAPSPGKKIPFSVDEKISENKLVRAAVVIEDYKIHHHKVEAVYSEFDQAGKNKSKSVLDAFRNSYLKLSGQHSGDDLYFQVVDSMIAVVAASKNYKEIPIDELDLCVNVLAVDAFIRCKIFKNPAEVKNASA